ncbi:hypothetical protein EVAR_69668_1 [Eumeta japonica]|uniref:Uncharacterized protein n=1 Tax=Eumeta variegata TaxID=151549 RepID=A0A4C1ZRM6_EUMVA|nr:hypothetical protein EVAR_69668_1 [Eumeta japonica]
MKASKQINDGANTPAAGATEAMQVDDPLTNFLHRYSWSILRSRFRTQDGDGSSWSCCGLVMIKHGVTMMGKHGFPRRTVEEKRKPLLK